MQVHLQVVANCTLKTQLGMRRGLGLLDSSQLHLRGLSPSLSLHMHRGLFEAAGASSHLPPCIQAVGCDHYHLPKSCGTQSTAHRNNT